jgi:carboxypeptidase family protein
MRSIFCGRRLIFSLLALIASAGLPAQGVTTATIGGIVRDEHGQGIPFADIEVLHRATGFITRIRTREDGRYTASGLDVGGPYAISVRHLGYEPAARDSIYVSIGQTLRVDVVLAQRAVMMQPITTSARAAEQSHPAFAVGTLISDSLVHRLPISDRDLYGLVKLVPQMSTWYGLSAAGASPRVNAIMIDGASEQGLYGGNAAAAIWGGKAISLEAVKEYQVLLSPFDVRHGNFAGALINAVTRSGSNELHGGVFYYGRYGALSRNVPFIRDAYYERGQAGFTIGGPLVRDRAHAFVAAEFQRLRFPTVGPYVGQPADATPAVQVNADTLARFASILSQLGVVGGSAGPMTAGNPVANVFGRLDIALPSIRSRLVIRENYSRADSMAFSRPSPPPTANCRSIACFPLSSLARRQLVWKDGTVAQLLTTLNDGSYNELIVGRLSTVGSITPAFRQPLIIVQLGQTTLGQTLQAGSYEVAQGDRTDNRSIELTDNLSVPRGAHNLTLGGSAQLFRIRRVDLRGAFGVWTFPSLDALARGQAQTYRVSSDFGGADVTVPGVQYALYAGDRWDASGRVRVTYGLRADIPVLHGRPPFNVRVDTLFQRRTDDVPSGRIHWSPRLGVSWEAQARARLMGGAGVYMGRPPLSWIINAYGNYGMPRTLTCGAAPARPPAFSADADNPPLACLNDQGLTPDSVGPVNLLDPRLRFPQNFRASFSLERVMPSGLSLRVETQYTHAINELFFVQRNLAVPASGALDSHGRLMYGTLGLTGRATPALARPTFNADVIELTNQSKDYAYSVTAGLRKHFVSNLAADVSFTYARARDVQSHRFTRSPASDNWRLGRTVTGRQDIPILGTSDFDQPYRVVASGTYAFVHRSSTTDVSLYYVGASGFPFTYLAGGDQQTGDLNADGTPLNDPIYIPRDVNDRAEILFDSTVFSAASQGVALESFIRGAGCLRHQRGRIMERNSCRTPWTNTLNAAIRQSVPRLKGVAAELQVFNLPNLLNHRWGRVAIPTGLATPSSQVNLLTHTGQSLTAPSQSVFRFDPATRRFDATNVDSYYQIQMGVRYSW